MNYISLHNEYEHAVTKEVYMLTRIWAAVRVKILIIMFNIRAFISGYVLKGIRNVKA
jgi:hypothetical protein